MPPVKTFGERIADALVEDGLLTARQVEDPLNVLAIDDVKRITMLEVAPLIAAEKAIIDKLNHIDSAKSGSMEDIIQETKAKAETEAAADENVEISKEAVEEVNLDQLAAS